jgi:hypothetical protein
VADIFTDLNRVTLSIYGKMVFAANHTIKAFKKKNIILERAFEIQRRIDSFTRSKEYSESINDIINGFDDILLHRFSCTFDGVSQTDVADFRDFVNIFRNTRPRNVREPPFQTFR